MTNDVTEYSGRPLWAMHLEVFVPKPAKWRQENYLRRFLDELLRNPTIVRRDRKPQEVRGLCQTHRTLFDAAESWENIIYGYSSYFTDGYFMPLNKERRREPETCVRETTLVFKFIVTNYRTQFPDRLRAPNQAGPLHPVVLAEGSDELSEFLCMHLHYEDTCKHIVDSITERVMPEDEQEVWSQAWYTFLTRRSLGASNEPIANPDEERFGAERVIRVCDYSGTKS